MLPVNLLMAEHRLIERMIKLMATEFQRISYGEDADTVFIATAVDFIRMYADKCHHGKEEAILFRDAAKKPLAPELKKILEELLEEHTFGRNTTKNLLKANESYSKGTTQAKEEIKVCLKALAEFYPKHIEKEDNHFFLPSMEYFSETEREDMLKAFLQYDENLIHEIYRQKVENYEVKA